MLHKPKSPFTDIILEKKMTVKDYLVSGKVFELYYDRNWDMMLTFPQPNNLNEYYISKNYQPHKKNKNTFFDRIYNFIRKYSYQYKYRLVKKYHPKAETILDYGTATGEFLEFMLQKSFKISGVEPNEDARKKAKSLLGNVIHCSVNEIEQKFDVITLWHVLEHVRDLKSLIAQLKTKLQPNGIIIIAVPNFKSYDAKYYAEYWAAYDVPRHLWHFSSKSIQKLFQLYELNIIDQKPLYFDSFYVSLLSEQYKTNKKNLLSATYIGLLSNLKASKTGEYSSLIYIIK